MRGCVRHGPPRACTGAELLAQLSEVCLEMEREGTGRDAAGRVGPGRAHVRPLPLSAPRPVVGGSWGVVRASHPSRYAQAPAASAVIQRNRARAANLNRKSPLVKKHHKQPFSPYQNKRGIFLAVRQEDLSPNTVLALALSSIIQTQTIFL